MTERLRFPAEWEPQSAVLIAWPHEGTDWAERLAEVEETYIALVAAITRFQRAIVCVADDDVQAYARARLSSARIDMSRVEFVEVPYDDTWLRDSGPISLRDGDGFRLLDFRFTGWGGKFEASLDDQLIESLRARGVFGDAKTQGIDFALEGGAIDTDGVGTLLTTWQCLHERHPDKSRDELTAKLSDWLAQSRVLWLDHGYLEGDDTDAHVDTLARFAARDAIVYQDCDDPADSHFTELQAMGKELAALRTGLRHLAPAGVDHGQVAVHVLGVDLDDPDVAQVVEAAGARAHPLQTVHDRHAQLHLVDVAAVVAACLAVEVLIDDVVLPQVLVVEGQHRLEHGLAVLEVLLDVVAGRAQLLVGE